VAGAVAVAVEVGNEAVDVEAHAAEREEAERHVSAPRAVAIPRLRED
jgi:hypothetical protein